MIKYYIIYIYYIFIYIILKMREENETRSVLVIHTENIRRRPITLKTDQENKEGVKINYFCELVDCTLKLLDFITSY